MKLFSWVQNKLSGNQSISKPHIHPCHTNQIKKSVDQKEEFSDWPNGVLSIGTLFNKAMKDDDLQEAKQEKDFTLEEVKQLQKELNALISSTNLDCLSSFEAGEKTDENDHPEESDEQHYTIIPNKGKEVYLDNNMSTAISKKSLTFLLKKMFICGRGNVPSPRFSLRDPTIIPPPKTKMNKILRALLRKKIHPQSSSPTMTRKICSESRQTGNNNFDDDDYDNFYLEGSDSSKWVKTDTEYIVLEI